MKYNIFSTEPKLTIVIFMNLFFGVFCITQFESEVKTTTTTTWIFENREFEPQIWI